MAEYVPGYKFMPQYTMGSWDGKTRFSTVGGRSFQVFIPEIMTFLKARGYTLKLNDTRPIEPIDVSLVDDQLFSEYNWILRPHQVEAINSIISNDHRGVILACTGSGKTTIVCGLSKVYGDIGFRSIVIVPNRDLIQQTIDQYEKLGMDVGEFSGKVKDLDHAHIISTWQALKNLPSILQMFQVIMIDECHGARSQIVSELLIKHGSHIPVRIGCTGTMPKDPADYKTIYAAIGYKEVCNIDAVTLQRAGLLATLHINMIELKDTPDPTKNRFPEWKQEKDALILDDERNQWLASFINNLADTQGNTLVLVSSVKQGKAIQKAIGDDSVFLYGQDSEAVRREMYDSFETNDNIKLIANVQIAGTGLSINRIFNVVLIDVGKAFTRVLQTIGRGLRLSHDKSHVDVYDIGSNYSFGAGHAIKRQKYYREAEYAFSTSRVNYRVLPTT